ncbi:hypothetical protein MTO96_048389 [Rhipicephalus appendiculatus]
MKGAICTKLLLLMCLRAAQIRAADVSTIFDCAKGELNATNKDYVKTGGPEATSFKLEITGDKAPYDVTLSTKTGNFFEAYVGLYTDDKPVPDGLSTDPPGKAEKCTEGKTVEMVAYTTSTTELKELKMKFEPDSDFAKDGDKKIVAKGFVCTKAKAGKTPCSAQIVSESFTVKKSGGKPPPPPNPGPGPGPGGGSGPGPVKPDGPKPHGDPPNSAPHGSSPNAAFRWKATSTLPTAFMVPALVTLLIIIALRQFPVFPYAFITMY